MSGPDYRWGYLNAFGVFQNYYKNVFIPESSNSQISWIGSMQGDFHTSIAEIDR